MPRHQDAGLQRLQRQLEEVSKCKANAIRRSISPMHRRPQVAGFYSTAFPVPTRPEAVVNQEDGGETLV